jgi:hypothetical protein
MTLTTGANGVKLFSLLGEVSKFKLSIVSQLLLDNTSNIIHLESFSD